MRNMTCKDYNIPMCDICKNYSTNVKSCWIGRYRDILKSAATSNKKATLKQFIKIADNVYFKYIRIAVNLECPVIQIGLIICFY